MRAVVRIQAGIGKDIFQLLHNDPFAEHRNCDSEGNKLCTLLKKRNPHIKGILRVAVEGGLELKAVTRNLTVLLKVAQQITSEVSESSSWVSIREYFTPPDVLVLRAVGPKWNNVDKLDSTLFECATDVYRHS